MKIKKGEGEREAESKNGRIREKRNLKAEREEEEGTEGLMFDEEITMKTNGTSNARENLHSRWQDFKHL